MSLKKNMKYFPVNEPLRFIALAETTQRLRKFVYIFGA